MPIIQNCEMKKPALLEQPAFAFDLRGLKGLGRCKPRGQQDSDPLRDVAALEPFTGHALIGGAGQTAELIGGQAKPIERGGNLRLGHSSVFRLLAWIGHCRFPSWFRCSTQRAWWACSAFDGHVIVLVWNAADWQRVQRSDMVVRGIWGNARLGRLARWPWGRFPFGRLQLPEAQQIASALTGQYGKSHRYENSYRSGEGIDLARLHYDEAPASV